MPYLSLYRKYRSQTFSDLLGQNHVVRTLQNGISSGKIAHAYLFTGPRGTGKTSTARLLAKSLCCEKGPAPEPCNQCSICQSITDGSCLDVYEMDAASEAGVEQVRDAIVSVSEYSPAVARYKVFIIDEVHDLSGKAFDALLKTVEEPPDHVIFILATTEYGKVPPTIRSRCQKHEFHRATLGDLVARLSHVAAGEGIEAEPAALGAIARMADGAFRDALTIFEQVMVTTGEMITLQGVYEQLGLVSDDVVDSLLVAMREGDIANLTRIVSDITRLGRDPRALLESILYRLADMTRVAFGLESTGVADPARDAALHETAARIGSHQMLRIRSDLAEAHKVIRDITLPRLWLEAELVRMAQALQAPAPQPKAQPKPEAAARTPSQPKPPQPRPEPEAPRPPEPKPEPQPEPSTGDPAVDRARDVWAAAKTALAEVSKLMAMKLVDTRVVAQDGATIVIEFRRQAELDWVVDGPKRRAAILEAIQNAAGEPWEPDYVLAQRAGAPAASHAHTVELPSEGQKLVQMAREVFSAPEQNGR